MSKQEKLYPEWTEADFPPVDGEYFYKFDEDDTDAPETVVINNGQAYINGERWLICGGLWKST